MRYNSNPPTSFYFIMVAILYINDLLSSSFTCCCCKTRWIYHSPFLSCLEGERRSCENDYTSIDRLRYNHHHHHHHQHHQTKIYCHHVMLNTVWMTHIMAPVPKPIFAYYYIKGFCRCNVPVGRRLVWFLVVDKWTSIFSFLFLRTSEERHTFWIVWRNIGEEGRLEQQQQTPQQAK